MATPIEVSYVDVLAPAMSTADYDALAAKLWAAFDRVRDTSNWKMPINALIEVKDAEELALIDRAITHFTGSVPTVKRRKDGRYRIRAAGYYMTIGS